MVGFWVFFEGCVVGFVGEFEVGSGRRGVGDGFKVVGLNFWSCRFLGWGRRGGSMFCWRGGSLRYVGMFGRRLGGDVENWFWSCRCGV